MLYLYLDFSIIKEKDFLIFRNEVVIAIICQQQLEGSLICSLYKIL